MRSYALGLRSHDALQAIGFKFNRDPGIVEIVAQHETQIRVIVYQK
jgi:hypothetical protein